MIPIDSLKNLLGRALAARTSLIDPEHITAFRLFAGFYEGCPALVADIYATNLVLYGYGDSDEESHQLMQSAQDYLLENLPWINCVIQKIRNSNLTVQRRGVVTYSDQQIHQIREYGIWYAVDLLLNQDASFYLDSRNLRQWLLKNVAGLSILNFFAYTGSLGVSALAGKASQVVQVDRNPNYLQFAYRSCELNHLSQEKMSLVNNDFFPSVAQFKRTAELFDVVIIDPPYFSKTSKGVVDLAGESQRVINKIRPLVKDGGQIIAINNALFLKGADYWTSLEQLCQDGYLSIETILPIPPDITGYPETVVTHPPVDPAPFNHPTKIVLLKVRRKI
jgi:23S rRNA (cytosine1962-C5)-methyltransferase